MWGSFCLVVPTFWAQKENVWHQLAIKFLRLSLACSFILPQIGNIRCLTVWVKLQPLSSGGTAQRHKNKRSSSHLWKKNSIIHMSSSDQVSNSLSFATQRVTLTWQRQLRSCWYLCEVAQSLVMKTTNCFTCIASRICIVMIMIIINDFMRVISAP